MKNKNFAVRIFSAVMTAVMIFALASPIASALTMAEVGTMAGNLISQYAEAYKMAYAEAEKNGIIDQINSFFDEAESVFDWAEGWVRENPELVADKELEIELIETVRNGRITLGAIQDVINNADALDEVMLSYASRLLDTLYVNVSDLFDLLFIAARIAEENLPTEIEDMIARAEKEIAEIGQTAEEMIGELEAKANEKIAEVTAAAEEKIAKLKENANVRIKLLGDLLNSATPEEKERIFNEIRKTEDELAAEISEIEAALEAETAEITAWLLSAIDRVNSRLDLDVEAIMSEVGEAIDAITVAVNEIIRLSEMNETVNAAFSFVSDGINNLYLMAEKYMSEVFAYLTTFDYVAMPDSFYLAIGNDTAYSEFFADGVSLREDQRMSLNWDEITPEAIAKSDLISISFNENQLSDFAIEQMLGYIGSFVQEELRFDFVAYVEVAISKLLSTAVPLLKPFIEKTVTESVTTSVNQGIDAFCEVQLGGNLKTELDWGTLIGEENVAFVDAIRQTLSAEIINLGIEETFAYEVSVVDMIYDNIDNIESDMIILLKLIGKDGFTALLGEYATYTVNVPLADAVMFSAESYVYSYIQFAMNYSSTVAEITSINPDAKVILLGHYNAFGGLTMSIGDTYINLGEIYRDISRVASATPFAHAVFYDNVIYVDIADAQTIFGARIAEGESSDAFMFAFNYLNDRTLTNISEAGHKYIADKMLEALKYEVEDDPVDAPPAEPEEDVLTPIILTVAACSVLAIVVVSIWISSVEKKKDGSPDEDEAE